MLIDVTIWDWLFDSPSSSLKRNPSSILRGYSNGVTGERINYAQVQEATSHLSTALVKRYGLKNGEVVALFSHNTIWYPMAMLGTLRAGMLYGLPEARGTWLIDRLNNRRDCFGCFAGLQRRRNDIRAQQAGAKFVMTVPAAIDVAVPAAKNAGIPKHRIFLLEGTLERFTTLKTLLDLGKSSAKMTKFQASKYPKARRIGMSVRF